jgi:hypothetical protein
VYMIGHACGRGPSRNLRYVRARTHTNTHGHTQRARTPPVKYVRRLQCAAYMGDCCCTRAPQGTPVVIVQPRFAGTEGFQHPGWRDAFGAEVTEVHHSGFNVNVARLDKLDNTGWMQLLRLDYFAFNIDPPGEETTRHRSGRYKVGHTGSKRYKGQPKAINFFVPFAVPLEPPPGAGEGPTTHQQHPTTTRSYVAYGAHCRVLGRCTTGGELRVVTTCAGRPGESFSDVHTVVVHEVTARGFNATVARADSLVRCPSRLCPSRIGSHTPLSRLQRTPFIPMAAQCYSAAGIRTSLPVRFTIYYTGYLTGREGCLHTGPRMEQRGVRQLAGVGGGGT